MIELQTRRAILANAAAAATATVAMAPGLAFAAPGVPEVETLAALVEAEYPEETRATEMARALRRANAKGDYAALELKALALRLTEDLRAIGQDQHLSVRVEPGGGRFRAPPPSGPPTPSPPTPLTPSKRAAEVFGEMAYGVARVERLAGNIGLLEIDNFAPLYGVTRARYGQAMSLLADTRGLIVDLRRNGGGASDSPAHLVSYLFERPPFVLAELRWRRLPAEFSRTTRDLAGPNYGESRPVAVLVSEETFSAAEAVAYELQTLKRAKVVGETTRGGANPGDFFHVGRDLVAFVPQGRAINWVTGGNWEGTGVQPDVPAPAAAALVHAHGVMLRAALLQARSEEEREAIQAEISKLAT